MQREQIIQIAQSLFMSQGIRMVSIELICEELGISKKTLYRYFESKDELIRVCVIEFLEKSIAEKNKLKLSAKDAIGELLILLENNKECHKSLQPIFISDLKKHHRPIWLQFTEFLDSHIQKNISDNILRGQQEGLYRLDINIPFVTHLYAKGIFSLLEYFGMQSQYAIAQLDTEFILYHIRAIGTPKALKIISNYKFDHP